MIMVGLQRISVWTYHVHRTREATREYLPHQIDPPADWILCTFSNKVVRGKFDRSAGSYILDINNHVMVS